MKNPTVPVLTLTDFPNRCDDPECKHECCHELQLVSKCCDSDEVRVCMNLKTGILSLSCGVCGEPLVSVLVASALRPV
jgi:hypothetical protein